MSTPNYFWRFANAYARLLGRAWLAPIHRALLNLALHGLGYDNARHTGEEWFVKNILKKENLAVCIDIGANVGAYTALLADNLNCTIYSIEPSSSSFATLKKTAQKYPGHVHTINAALSDREGTATLYSREPQSEKATLNAQAGAGSALKEEVHTTTLDALLPNLGITKVDFIKMDTEGYEREVLKGMQQTLLKLQPKFVQFEFNHIHLYSDTTLYQLTKLLAGYEFYRLLPRGWMRIDPSKQSSNIFMFCNIIAKRM